MQAMTHNKSFALTFTPHGERSYTKIHCEDDLTALNYFNFFFPEAELIDIEESMVQIIIEEINEN